jgi:K+-sensing histidine kinase KdpD
MHDDDRSLGAVICGVAALVVSIAIGIVFRPVRTTIGLENIVLLYAAIVAIAAASAGQLAGVLAAVSAALGYNFFFTTPYKTLKIDSVEQIVTVLLLFATGVVASLTIGVYNRASRRSRELAIARETQALEAVAEVLEAEAAGENLPETAVRVAQELLGATWVAVLPRGADTPLASEGTPPSGDDGISFPIRHLGVPDGALTVLPRTDRPPTPSEFAALTAIADALGGAGVLSDRR